MTTDAYKVAYEREKTARENDEALLEDKSRLLYESQMKLNDQESHIIQSERMASLGSLAAGIAHEINNPIGFVLSNTATLQEYFETIEEYLAVFEGLKQKIKDDKKYQDSFDKLEKFREESDMEFVLEDAADVLSDNIDGLKRVQKIVAGLKTFAYGGNEEPQEADIHEIIESALRVLSSETKHKAKIVKKFSKKAGKVCCFPEQLCQVFTNLVQNAAQAIEGEGTITLITDLKDKAVMVTVKDTGCGIPQDKIQRIFTPFFTTKAVGEGTGLGLSISHGIIENHGGSIFVSSEEGKGTTFEIMLPEKGVKKVQTNDNNKQDEASNG